MTSSTPEPISASAAAESGAARSDLWFPSGQDRCAAWLYLPEGVERPPLVIMGHGLGATRHMRLPSYAQRFADAGYAALVFDYRSFGDSEGMPRQVVDVRRQLDDWKAALAYARAELPVDTSRIALWGTSFGGGHVLQAAAEDGKVQAVVSQCPFTDGLASTTRRFLTNPISATVLFVAAIIDTLGSLLRLRPLKLPMAGTSWMPAFMAAPDSLPGAASQAESGSVLSARTSRTLARLPRIRRKIGSQLAASDRAVPKASDTIWGVLIAPDGALIINAIAARLVLRLSTYRPGRALRRTGNTPILICACDNDTVAPVGPTVRAARKQPNVQLIRYPYGHFEIYLGDAFERAIGDQLAFLQQHLAPTVAAPH